MAFYNQSMNILKKTLNLIDDIINSTQIQNMNFYNKVLETVSSLYDFQHSLSLFFCENTGYSLKATYKNNKEINNYNLPENIINGLISNSEKSFEIKTSKDELFFKNCSPSIVIIPPYK